MKIDIDQDLRKKGQKVLADVLSRAGDLLPYFEVKAQELDALIMVDSLAQSRSPFGEAFEPLSDVTIENRRKGKGSGGPTPLVDTGTMRKGIFVKPTKQWIEFGVSGAGAVYAGTHIFGRKRMAGSGRPFGGAAIPARPFLPVKGESPQDAKADFSKGPAKAWYDGMIDGLLPYLADGAKG